MVCPSFASHPLDCSLLFRRYWLRRNARQRMRDADTLFTGEGQNQLFLQPPSSMSTATRRSLDVFVSAAASYDQDYGLVGDAGEFCAICWHFIGPDAVLIFSGFLDRLARKPTTSRLIITFRPSPFAVVRKRQHRDDLSPLSILHPRQADKFRRIERANIAFTGIHK